MPDNDALVGIRLTPGPILVGVGECRRLGLARCFQDLIVESSHVVFQFLVCLSDLALSLGYVSCTFPVQEKSTSVQGDAYHVLHEILVGAFVVHVLQEVKVFLLLRRRMQSNLRDAVILTLDQAVRHLEDEVRMSGGLRCRRGPLRPVGYLCRLRSPAGCLDHEFRHWMGRPIGFHGRHSCVEVVPVRS